MTTSSPASIVAQKALNRVCLPPVHADLILGIGEAVVAGELADDRGLQLRRAVDIRVFRDALADRLDRGFLDEVGRVEIGLACAQTNHVDALSFQLEHTARHRERGGRLDTIERGGSLHGRSPVWRGTRAL
jgi:hypothetical protein